MARLSIAVVKQFMPNRNGKNSKTKARSVCKCLSCEKSHREKDESKTLLICGDEACSLNCAECTERPTWDCGYRPLPVVTEIYEGEWVQA